MVRYRIRARRPDGQHWQDRFTRSYGLSIRLASKAQKRGYDVTVNREEQTSDSVQYSEIYSLRALILLPW